VRVSDVASSAQFTPKTVATASERQKLTFRFKVHLAVDGSAVRLPSTPDVIAAFGLHPKGS
jgi:hypothetical protein